MHLRIVTLLVSCRMLPVAAGLSWYRNKNMQVKWGTCLSDRFPDKMG